MREIECDRCGRSFTCQITDDTGCWCAAFAARLPVPLPGSGHDCRCPDCILTLGALSQRSSDFGSEGDLDTADA
jgi:hypothetical protein